ncbi:MAG: NAD-dependent epimerase/dehydratase family protein [Candidatus Krumholzibacteria bacterium]|nr:NAD-dependent epimerase/dehydratase family protein [Candidatus Krumholzibacteria bacterium]
MSRIALVTGANGFVGSHLCEHLLDGGWRVRALVRRTSDLRWLDARAERVIGEVTAAESLAAAVEGADTVFHLAGVTRAAGAADYDRVNVTGCEHVARAAARAQRAPRRIVLASSLAAGGPSTPQTPRVESDPDAPSNAYGVSKRRGETALRAHAGGVDWTAVRPAAVYGPRDRAFVPLARLARSGWTLRLSGNPQPVSAIHVRDLVRGIVAAALADRATGETYYLTHDTPVTWEAVGRTMAAALGRRARTLGVPRAIVPLVALAAGSLARLSGRPNRMPRDRVADLFQSAWTCSGAKARAQLGFEAAIDYEQGMTELARWYREAGWIRA